ncbi:peptidoglycan-associated lipoprotein Pal [Salinisphaera sp.]|uniref:peptidoglycan-associated lipoprotein Pal n=1 Tax=Salinisphaera sp. TaxID=1914330 RepID=UPI002D76B88C|nr:peptidoglycan-associated lipoprotein Pal [Salinisphaera sp.]HET7314332.1 peptidoglycan-associated lipoprotein Pal [Salinisphaera sp.]
MRHTDFQFARRLMLVMVLLATAIAVTACGGNKNIRGNGSMPQAGMQGGNGQAAGMGSRRNIDVRGLEGVPAGDRHMFTDPSNPLSTRTIYFPLDSSSIPSRYSQAIQAHAQYLANHRGVHLRLEGNTDERGTREYNVALGERRADSVKQALVLSGANAGQITTISYGEERPAELGHTEAAYAKNRRVDFIYTNH